MAEQTFRSPNFFDREIDVSGPVTTGPTGVPAGIIGASNKGPAFVPVTVANFNEFNRTFGNLDPNKPAPYAVNEFLKNMSSLTFLRVLGAGSNKSLSDITTTETLGTVENAGFKFSQSSPTNGGIFFLATEETQPASETSVAMFSDNDTFKGATLGRSQLVRAALFLPTGSKVSVFDGTSTVTSALNESSNISNSSAITDSSTAGGDYIFKIAISSSYLVNNLPWSSDDGIPGLKIFSASLNPTKDNYIGKILNTDPSKFVSQQHLLYADFAVDHEMSYPTKIMVMSGSASGSASGKSYNEVFGSYNTRFKAPQTPSFISQPFGTTEYDLFKFEAIDDGEFANKLYKVSITNIKSSVDPQDPYGSFSVQIRDWNDTDFSPNVIEQFDNLNLNPDSAKYIGKVIGNRKVYYNFDANDPTEKRILSTGLYENNSAYVRVLIEDHVEMKKIPSSALPFGFRGPSTIKTTNGLIASGSSMSDMRMGLNSSYNSSPVLPPIPYRAKITRGPLRDDATSLPSVWPTSAVKYEVLNPNFYWGVKFERNNDIMGDVNSLVEKNRLISSITKFMGIEKLDALATGSYADSINNNKFTLARVAFNKTDVSSVRSNSVTKNMLEAAYVRNGVVDSSTYKISSSVTFATLLNQTDANAAQEFNKYSSFAKFTTFMMGGFDGLNFLDDDARKLNDLSVSFDSDGGRAGGASSGYKTPGMSTGNGSTTDNNGVASYRTAADIMTDPYNVTINLIAMPGIREPYLTDYVSGKTKDYGLAMFVMDIPAYDDNSHRLYDSDTAKPNITNTINNFSNRAIDNNYASTYFPDVFIDDVTNRRKVKVPASVAAVNALAFNDKVAYPWFAPAGFNRAALDFVSNVSVRLNVPDRDALYDARINPIATFPRLGYVIYGQKTLQVKKSALDRVNVRRLLLEVKRQIVGIANNLVFEQNTPDVRNKFVADSSLRLGLIQAQAGIEAFQVVMNETNNSQDDIDNNRLRGRIVVVPTRTIEYIAIDFIVANGGVQFV